MLGITGCLLSISCCLLGIAGCLLSISSLLGTVALYCSFVLEGIIFAIDLYFEDNGQDRALQFVEDIGVLDLLGSIPFLLEILTHFLNTAGRIRIQGTVHS